MMNSFFHLNASTEYALKRKHLLKEASKRLQWASINAALGALLYLQIYQEKWFIEYKPLMPYSRYVAISFVVFLVVNAVWNMVLYLWQSSGQPVDLTDEQKKLLGINQRDSSFSTTPPRKAASITGHTPATPLLTPRTLPVSITPIVDTSGSSLYQNRLIPAAESFNSSTYGFRGQCGQETFPASMSQRYSLTPNGDRMFASVVGSTPTMRNGLSTSASPGKVMWASTHDDSPLRSRSINKSASFNNSNISADDSIRNLDALQDYFRAQEDILNEAATPPSQGSGQSFWNFHRGPADFGAMLRKYAYQVACRSPLSVRNKDGHSDDGPSHYEAEEVWHKFGVSPKQTDLWIENLRKWLGKTIMIRLAQQIDSLNAALSSFGCYDMEIGAVSVVTLKQLSMSVTLSSQLSTLGTLIPFLELTSNQEYLVKRIKELGGSSCMADFTWNGGSKFKDKPWDEFLPTDAELVMHMLCCYMDARLPPNPMYPDGRTFTSNHFIKDPAKPDLEKKENLCIYQFKKFPPHYKVVLKDSIWNLPRGRNNMFYAILLFLLHIKKHEHGMIGKVNLGMSGINILWVIDED